MTVGELAFYIFIGNQKKNNNIISTFTYSAPKWFPKKEHHFQINSFTTLC